MSKVAITKEKLDNLANAVAAKSGIPILLTVDEMTDAVLGIGVGEENILEGVKLDGVELPIVDKKVNIPVVGPNQAVGLMTGEYMNGIYNYIGSVSNSIPTSTSQLTNDSGFITSETDPTVPAWAKASTKPTYTAAEVGALPDSTVIPSKTSDLTNDSGFITNDSDEKLAVTDISVTDPKAYYLIFGNGTAATTRHYDTKGLRYEVSSNDSGLLIGYNNPSKEGRIVLFNDNGYFITLRPSTSLTESGKHIYLPNTTGTLALTSQIPTVPTTVSSFTNDAGYLTSYTETDPTVPSWAKQSSKPTYTATEVGAMSTSHAANAITSSDISNWNSKTTNTTPLIFKGNSGGTISYNGMGGDEIRVSGYDGITIANEAIIVDDEVTPYSYFTVTFNLTTATATKKGGVKPWYSHTVASIGPTAGSNATAITVNAISTDAGKYYAVESDSNGRLFVNVPWTNVNNSYLTSETDPTVPSWAKASTKPSYTFSEITSKPTTLSGYGITDAYTKTQVDGLVAGVLHYKGTKATVSELPSSGNTTGDTWHVTADGSEWAWDGSQWQELGTAVDLSGYAQLSGASFTGPVTFGDSISADEATIGDLVVNGAASFTNNISANTINGVAVGNNPKFTDTVTTVSVTGSGNAVTAASASNGVVTLTKGETFLTSYTETDPVFSASAAAGITSTDISNWNAKPSTDTNTTYTLSNALSSHKFTSTLTAGGSGSGTSTATMEFVAGTGITLTDDTTNKKITIASSVVNTDEKLKVENVSDNTNYSIILNTLSTSTATTKYDDGSCFKYKRINGTSEAVGTSTLILGNDSNSLPNSIKGQIKLYALSQSTIITPGTPVSGGNIITLPNTTGTLALTSDIPSVYSSTNTGGYLTMATLPIYDGTVE